MTKAVYLSILMLFIAGVCKADTIDYWHVYYNQTKIREYNQFGNAQTIVLKLAEIRSGDSITVKYFRDTPCTDCSISLSVEDGKHRSAVTKQAKGTFTPTTFTVDDLLRFREKSGQGTFEVLYQDERIELRNQKLLLFGIKLE